MLVITSIRTNLSLCMHDTLFSVLALWTVPNEAPKHGVLACTVRRISEDLQMVKKVTPLPTYLRGGGGGGQLNFPHFSSGGGGRRVDFWPRTR